MSVLERLRPWAAALFRSAGYLWLAGLAALALSFVGFAKLAEDVRNEDPLVQLDGNVALWLHQHASAALTAFFDAVTHLGGTHVVVGATALLVAVLIAHRRGWDAALILTAVAGGELLNAALKAGFHRPRPELSDPLASAGGFSFPSGHSMAAFIFYGAVAYLACGICSTHRQRVACIAAASTAILLVGVSRMYLGVHYLSDVLAGYAAGAAWLFLCLLGFSAARARPSLRPQAPSTTWARPTGTHD